MRFWFAASISPTAFGGIHRSMNVLAAELRHYGHTTTVYYARPGKEQYKFRFAFSLAIKLLLSLWGRPHWIIARSTDGLFCAFVAKLFRMKTRVALHNHGWEERVSRLERRLPAALVNNPTTWRARFIGFMLLRLTLKYSYLCISGTIGEARWIANRYPQMRRKLTVIPNGVDPQRDAFWVRQPERPPSFLLVGGFTWKKNLEYGVEVFRRFLADEPAARLFIVGCGSLPESRKQLLLPLGDAVFTVESEIPEKMSRWYETCPMLLFPSRYEGGRPFTVLEAQSRGCMVFAADIPAVRECIDHGKTGFMLSGVNPTADAAFIASVYQNRELGAEVARAAWHKSLRNRSQRQGQRLIKIVLLKTVRKKPRPASA